MSNEPRQSPQLGPTVDERNPILLEPYIALKGIKELAAKLLPSKSPARRLILTEQEFLPRIEAIHKMELIVRLLYDELKGEDGP